MDLCLLPKEPVGSTSIRVVKLIVARHPISIESSRVCDMCAPLPLDGGPKMDTFDEAYWLIAKGRRAFRLNKKKEKGLKFQLKQKTTR